MFPIKTRDWISFIIVLGCFSFPVAHAEIQALRFHCDKSTYLEEREVLKSKYKEMYGDRDRLVDMADKNNEQTSIKGGDFCVAKTNLDQDGIEDIFIHSHFGALSCGTAGCGMQAFLIDRQGEWREVLSLHSYEDGVRLTDVINGYRTLLITQKIACPCDTVIHSDGTHILMNTKNVPYVFDTARQSYVSIGLNE